MASSALHLPQLTAENFSNWKFRVEAILDEKGVKYITTINDDKDFDEQQKKDDAKARSVIIQCVTDKHLEYIKDSKSARDMLASLKNVFQRKSTFSKLNIRRKLLSLKCNTNDLQEHFVNFDSLIRELEGTGCTLDESDKVCHLLLTMPEKYDNVITAIETMTTNITLEFVKSRLLDTELKLKNGKNPEANNGDECSFNVNKFQRRCFECGETTHLKPNCPKLYSNNIGNNFRTSSNYRGRNSYKRGNYYQQGKHGRPGRGNSRQFSNANISDTNSQEMINFVTTANQNMAECSLNALSKNNSIEFVVDSGATDHLVNATFENLFNNVEDMKNEVIIKIANGQNLISKKRGTLKVAYGNVNICIVALLVPNLSHNLLSVRKLNENNKKVLFTKNMAKIIGENNFIMNCYLSYNNLFIAKFYIGSKELNESKCIIGKNSDPDLWHKRLGHLNRKSLRSLNLPVSDQICEPCMKGKATRLPFKKVVGPRSKRVGELLHTDIGGPIAQFTNNNERYYQTVTDDFSHFSVVYLLREKSEAAENIKNFIRELQANGNRTARIRCDKGGELMSNNFKHFCQENGIRLETTVGYTPQQNGVSERLNRTLLDKVRTMFAETNLPKHLWGEAIRCAAYQLNRSPSIAINGGVPAEIFLGKLDLSKLKVFGSKAWSYNLPKGSKLDTRAQECRMVGYNSNGYRLWNPFTDKVFCSRDVRFDESDIKYLQEVNTKSESDVKYLQEEYTNNERDTKYRQEERTRDEQVDSEVLPDNEEEKENKSQIEPQDNKRREWKGNGNGTGLPIV